MKKLFFIVFIFFSFQCYSRYLTVNILEGYNTKKANFTSEKGEYLVESDVATITALGTKESVQIHYIAKEQIQVFKNGNSLGVFRKISFTSKDSTSYFLLSCKEPRAKIVPYNNDLEIKANGELLFYNKVEINNYVAGVLEGEIGNVKYTEFLKLQAVISRTYALKHLDRHKAEGFELCDKVHCQVYHGKCRFNLNIKPAVDSTDHLVILDENDQLIEAVFSANCGGQTCNSEDIWSKGRSYLRSVRDTFCLTEPQATWKKTISRNEWTEYLSQKTNQNITTPCAGNLTERKVTLSCCEVTYEDLRTDFRLRSTYFDIDTSGDLVILKGRGFGHGVGMCQEGAMRMAKLGRSYEEIIHHYYTSVQINSSDSVVNSNK
jgi:stage II sporulation protein D